MQGTSTLSFKKLLNSSSPHNALHKRKRHPYSNSLRILSYDFINVTLYLNLFCHFNKSIIYLISYPLHQLSEDSHMSGRNK